MTAPFAFAPTRIVVFGAAVALVFHPEAFRLIRRRSGADATRRDAGSTAVLSGCLGAGNAVAFFLALAAPGLALPRSRPLFWVGVVLTVAGAAFRWYAVRTLGRFFTTDVAVADVHAVVEDGPYRAVRHPAYTGGLASILGVGLALTNAAALLALAVASAAGYVYRIRVEERALREELGERYGSYAERTPYRLVPDVWWRGSVRVGADGRVVSETPPRTRPAAAGWTRLWA